MDEVSGEGTMVGVLALEPLISDHTSAHIRAGRAPDRWRRIAISSAKPCRRAVVPPIGVGTAFSDWLAQDRTEMRVLLVEPSAAVEGHPLATLSGSRPMSASLAVGPEGGWSVPEINAAVHAGCLPITLGRRTLRADAVPIVAIALLQFLWGDL